LAGGDPTVVVVGAGQGGLTVAARLKQLGVDTLIVERNPRVGDNWRNRYRSLVLHDPVWYDHLPYLPFPANWPVFTSKDKLADWFESYALAMELNVWTGTEVVGGDYDDDTERWVVRLLRSDGTERTLNPSHVVLATGISGVPTCPRFPVLATSLGCCAIPAPTSAEGISPVGEPSSWVRGPAATTSRRTSMSKA
jgi:putative flavoprotein involved in K+ transport